MYYTLLQTTPKIRSSAKLLATNSCITGFPLNLLNFIDTVIIYYADANVINENQRQPDSFCVLRGSFRSATVSAMYHSLCMNRPIKVVTIRQPQAVYQQPRDTYERNDDGYDYQDEKLSTYRSVNSQSNIELMRTQDFHRQASNGKNLSSSYTSSNGLLIAAGILLLLIIFIIAPSVLGVLLTRNPIVSNNSTTTSASTVYTAYWSFDNDANDLYGTYNGTLVNGASFSNTTYFGHGFNLALNDSVNQSVITTNSFFNLSYTSFTVEAWIYGIALTGDRSIFSQCQCRTCQSQCLYLIIRNYKMYMGFMLNDLVGSTSLSINTWYHVAYVYDYSSRTQSIYLQGVLDGTKTSASPYQGQNGSISIGTSYLSSSSFYGYMDNLKVTTRAKSASEILVDASVVVYFSFDGSTLTQDMGPNQLNGSLSNAISVIGKVGLGLAFSGSSSYLQIYGFYQLGRSSQSFSFALWIYPYSVTGGTLIHKSTAQYTTGSWCQDMMGLTYIGQIAFHTNGGGRQITGPLISTLEWTHIVYTYSSTNGQIMYINGVQYAATGSMSFSSSGTIDWLTVGHNIVGCSPSPISGGAFFGIIDEFYVYRRELSATEVYTLANP
ncbi:unnamed protein product [Rotaria sordida]|uniref:LamG-like jellyroll fold domain-containing protein n=1 Tax=Rotaria sordida TaxID=392033 RepID=A0A813ZJI7_9BILA|nr:unnamed protein product [Rotaria sordida]CAF3633226.1 unnamed protein product [Rotaria sordida]